MTSSSCAFLSNNKCLEVDSCDFTVLIEERRVNGIQDGLKGHGFSDLDYPKRTPVQRVCLVKSVTRLCVRARVQLLKYGFGVVR